MDLTSLKRRKPRRKLKFIDVVIEAIKSHIHLHVQQLVNELQQICKACHDNYPVVFECMKFMHVALVCRQFLLIAVEFIDTCI